MISFPLILQIIGQLVIITLIVIFIIFMIIIILGETLNKKDILILPSLMIFLIDIFYFPIKIIGKRLGFDEDFLDIISIKVRNKVNKKKFSEIPPEDTIMILPHCLRSANCEAPLRSDGVHCTGCNECVIGAIKKKADKLGYRIFIVPGSSFSKRIIKENDFKCGIGVACQKDLSLMLMGTKKYHPQGVLLTKDGCFETTVNLKELFEVMEDKDVLKNKTNPIE